MRRFVQWSRTLRFLHAVPHNKHHQKDQSRLFYLACFWGSGKWGLIRRSCLIDPRHDSEGPTGWFCRTNQVFDWKLVHDQFTMFRHCVYSHGPFTQTQPQPQPQPHGNRIWVLILDPFNFGSRLWSTELDPKISGSCSGSTVLDLDLNLMTFLGLGMDYWDPTLDSKPGLKSMTLLLFGCGFVWIISLPSLHIYISSSVFLCFFIYVYWLCLYVFFCVLMCSYNTSWFFFSSLALPID